MPEKRFFIDTALNGQCELEGEEAQHLKVMRCKEGDVVELINGKGDLAQAKIMQCGKKAISLDILTVHSEPKPILTTILAQALPRLNRLDTILEKCTELGVSKILLFPGETSEKEDLSDNQRKRIEHILIAASKQCGRLHFPELAFLPPLKKWLKPEGTLLYGDVSPQAPLLSKETFPITFFIGPEAGFTPAEEALLKDWGAKGIKLSNNILRTDTAAIAAVNLLNYFLLKLLT